LATIRPDFRDFHTLNYVAFCDAHDGNYLAILREGPEQGKVFFLDHEYLFRPYSERDADLYYTVAESLEAWLELVVKTKGVGRLWKACAATLVRRPYAGGDWRAMRSPCALLNCLRPQRQPLYLL
jgi:hypothetical protein